MTYIEQTQAWIKNFVIGLNLCPFAKHPFQNELIRYRLEKTTELEKLVETLIEELFFLQKKTPKELETTVIVHPNILENFYDYNDFLAAANDILLELNMEGVFQIASFHPNYQFAGERRDSVSNYVTRSPFPMLHLLREDSVETAIKMHPNTEQIPYDNMETLKKLGLEQINNLLKKD